jgi:hypothetical protein
MVEPVKPGLTPEQLHRRQAFFRIYLPVIVASLIVGLLVTLTVLASTSSPSIIQNWAHIAILIMVGPFILLFIALLVVVSMAVFGMYKVNHILPGRLKRIREDSVSLNTRSQKVISTAANPVIKTKIILSGVKALFQAVKGTFTRARR